MQDITHYNLFRIGVIIMNRILVLFLLFIIISCDKNPDKVLIDSIDQEDIQMIHSAVKNGADINGTLLPDITALQYAIMGGLYSSAKCLIDLGADIECGNSRHGGALHSAIPDRNMIIFKYVLSKKPNVNSQDAAGNTPLHHAVYTSNKKAVKLLLEYGASRTIKNTKGETPLDSAKLLNNECIDLLSPQYMPQEEGDKLPGLKVSRDSDL